MKQEFININHIPCVIWGESSGKVIIAVHGNMSNKLDKPIQILAEQSVLKGYQVISFDLPQHGERIDEKTLCKVQNCVEELQLIMNYVKQHWIDIYLFANSMGAYFSLLAYSQENIKKAWFLSPVVNMQRMIENMMMWFNINKEDLQEKQVIQTPIGQVLYWDYYQYVLDHPITHWIIPTSILYGNKDEMCEKDIILHFTKEFNATLEIVENSEHYFHTPKQLEAFVEWLENNV